MPESPLLATAEVVAFEILVDGAQIKDIDMVAFIEIESALNRIATAKLSFFLPVGDGDNNTFVRSESDDFVPGKKIELKVGSVSRKNSLFKGIIVRQSIRNLDGKTNELVVYCSDEAVKMTLSHKSAYYQDMKDSAIISQVIGEYGGLTASVDATDNQHKQIVKYQSCDWDFILSRAEANGLLVYTEEAKVNVKKPLASGSPGLSVDFGRDVISYDLGIESRAQMPSVACQAWDMKTQALVESKSTEPSLSKHGNLKGAELAGKIGIPADTAASTAPLDKNELKTWANAQTLKARLNTLQGSVSFFGNATPKLNTLLKIGGFGDRFNSEALITGIRHTVRAGFWQTTVQFGLSPEWHYEQQAVSAPPAGGLLPAIGGLQNGTVKKIDADPDGQFRILVDVPVIAATGAGIWARLAHFYATSGKGSFFLPEVGDEVVLGFLNDDPRFPVILGMLYSSKIKPPYTPDDKNKIKAIVTKNDLKIEFNDTDKILTIKTPAGNEFVLSDKDKSVTLKDQNGNKMEMTSSGITLNSPKDVVIKATGSISLDAVKGITAKASGGDVSLDGLNVQAKAKIGFAAQGSATAELKSSGMTSVKGSMVMIN
jgi:Rhs element Vgr protein